MYLYFSCGYRGYFKEKTAWNHTSGGHDIPLITVGNHFYGTGYHSVHTYTTVRHTTLLGRTKPTAERNSFFFSKERYYKRPSILVGKNQTKHWLQQSGSQIQSAEDSYVRSNVEATDINGTITAVSRTFSAIVHFSVTRTNTQQHLVSKSMSAHTAVDCVSTPYRHR